MLFKVGIDVDALGKALAERRRSLGLTQQALADRLGLPQPAIAKVEKAYSKGLGWATVIEFARALDLELVFVPRDRLREVEAVLRLGVDDATTPLFGDAWNE